MKRTHVVLTTVVTLLSLTLLFSVGSSVPSVVSYQGRVTDTAGQPLNGAYIMSFALYDTPTGGAQLWSETHSAVVVTEGLFSVQLGSVTPFPAGIWDTPTLYLGVTVGTDPEMDRTRFICTPYAMKAGAVDGYSPGPGNTVTGLYDFVAGDSNTILSDYSSIVGGLNNVIDVDNVDTSFDTSLSPGSVFNNWGGTSFQRMMNTGAHAFVGGGGSNHAHGTYCAIVGGYGDSALSPFSFLGAGRRNVIGRCAIFANISGGSDNWAFGRVSHIGGGYYNHTSTRPGPCYSGEVISGGYWNATNNHLAVIGGGRKNEVNGFAGTIAGGDSCLIMPDYCAIGGGFFNHIGGLGAIMGPYSTISGGDSNSITLGAYQTIGGGLFNQGINPLATIAGGDSSIATHWATVGGGHRNQALNDYAVVSGGRLNQATAFSTTVGGGSANTASGDTSTVGGGSSNNATVALATIAGGATNSVLTGGFAGAIGGGVRNVVSGFEGAVAGGEGNMANGTLAAVGGGSTNVVQGDTSVISGGYANTVDASAATLGGGEANIISANGSGAVIAGGRANTIDNATGFIGGGTGNSIPFVAGVGNATIPGGSENIAAGNNAFAAGTKAHAIDDCSFVWNDCCMDAAGVAVQPFHSFGPNSFNARAMGGFYFMTSCADTIFDATQTGIGAYIDVGGGAWINTSDSASKRNIRIADDDGILRQVAKLPVYRWSYKTQDPSIEHIGPMAQDFHAQFKVGGSERGISTIDPGGVSLAAIKALYRTQKELVKKTEELQRTTQRLSEKEAEIDALKKELEQTNAKVETISARMDDILSALKVTSSTLASK